MMKRAVVLCALIAAVPIQAGAQQAVDADLKRAKDMYVAGNVEGARQIFAGVITAKTQVTNAQKVEAYKYLGGSWAVLNKPDSASSYFIAALDYDPFATLDPKDFAPDERAAFDRARAKIFKVGIEPVKWAELNPGSTDATKRTYTFKVVSTHIATFNVSLVNLRDSTQGRETFPTFSPDGARDLPWPGTVNGLRADSGLYELKIVATDRLNPSNPPVIETHKFRIEHVYPPLEDTLPSFADSRTGGTDTLTSRLSGFVPVLDGSKGLFVAGVAASLPLIAFGSYKPQLSGWTTHFYGGLALGLSSGIVAAWWGANHRDDANAVAENARRRQARADFNAAVRARNKDRIDRTILVLRPVG